MRRSNDIRILGVTLDSNLNFKNHIGEQLKKAYTKASALRRIRRFLPTEKLSILYKTFILSHFDYCGPLLLGIGKVQSDQLDNANYYILRSVLGYGKFVPYEQLLSIINLTNLKQRRIYQSLELLYKCLFCNGSSYIRDLFHFRKTKYSRRGDGYILALPKFNLQWKKKSFSYAAAKYWNELPVVVRQVGRF